MITRASTPSLTIDHVIEMTQAAHGTKLDEWSSMRTIQISIGEIIEAMYEGLVETYGDKELALVAAQALSDDLLTRLASKPSTPKRDS